ncbi:hypothetical protein M408DRAFT_330752 [Serendipita vermifera MAFF 305830]|uniref:Uncharacterized protein n=1 Tax=Serendipita vermifera MAFF 305830 TaxID=933852 RepID=A0A0C2WIK2_SERVB|nr:hypothetical protein M408DRAFT_330752 [Serendipita vermifera MAFF 305830]
MDVVLARQVCRRFLDLIDGSIELQVRIELGADGFLLSDHGGMAASELLKLVLERRRAFEEFIPRSYWNVPFKNTQSVRREILDGVWGRSPDNRPEGTFRGIHFEELVSPTTEGGRWTLDRKDTGVDASDLSFWLDADALYLIEPLDLGQTWRIHFRHLSTNETHRLAFAPFIDFHRGDRGIWRECEIICHEKRLSVEFYDDRGPGGSRRTAVIIMDWTTGDILLPYTVTSDIAFLTPDLLMIARGLETDNPDIAAPDDIIFDIWSLEQNRTLWRCKMPISSSNYRVRYLKRPSSNKGPNCPTRYAKLFVPDPRVSILAMIFGTTTTASIEYFTVVLSVHAFLRNCRKLLEERAADRISGGDVPTFEWEEWGSDVTSWLPMDVHGSYGSRMVYGARMLAYLITPSEPDGLVNGYNTLLDFNPRPIRRAKEPLEKDEKHVRIQTIERETAWDDQGMGMGSLAYRQWISTRAFRYWNLDLEANTILARLEDEYHCYSFLPRGDSETEEPSLANSL